ncbi:hypothetical protein GCM10012286_44670 [Streptomyces lasiicapitis]|uniref:Uncharacterized protein n=1 Tax=Streptomyces lasiicapitis TaxID=1923961 RepID=A0ABQ2M9X4_9ACTN|nr:hypothetical protein GCM10012286_44670 [Streptomyces lasiicapitis]
MRDHGGGDGGRGQGHDQYDQERDTGSMGSQDAEQSPLRHVRPPSGEEGGPAARDGIRNSRPFAVPGSGQQSRHVIDKLLRFGDGTQQNTLEALLLLKSSISALVSAPRPWRS